MQRHFSDMWLFVIHAITKSVNGFLMTETGDLERRIWLSNVRKLYQPRMSDMAHTFNVCCAFWADSL